MVRQEALMQRREKISQTLAKSITSPSEIATLLGISVGTVQNDIAWLKNQTKPWLNGLALNGYAFDCKILIDKLSMMEKRYEAMLKEAEANNEKIFVKLAIMRELRETAIAKVNVEGKGPVLMTLRQVIKGDFKVEDPVEHKTD